MIDSKENYKFDLGVKGLKGSCNKASIVPRQTFGKDCTMIQNL